MHLAVLYRFPDEPQFWRQLEGGTCVLLSFLDGKIERAFMDRCHSRDVKVEKIVHAAEHIDTASKTAREKYSRFIARWPEQTLRGGKNFKQHFAHHGEISYWWLSSASAKDNEVYRSFDHLCHLELVRTTLAQQQIEGCLLVGGEVIFAELLREACRHDGVSFQAVAPSRRATHQPSIISAFWRRLKFIGWLLLELVFLKVLIRASRQPREDSLTAFLSLYPGSLEIRNGQVSDLMYRDVVEVVEDSGSLHSVIFCWFRGRGFSGLRQLYAARKTLGGDQRVLLLNSYLALSDIWLAIRNLGFFLRLVRLIRFDQNFRRTFIYDGIDIYRLLRWELSSQLLSNEVPYHLVVARAVHRAVKAHPVQRLVSFLELYPFSRAVFYGAKKANPYILTVAYQHANITKMRLWYTYQPKEILPRTPDGLNIDVMPIPDRYLFQGAAGLDIIRSSGYPEERCLLTGSPRYDELANRVRKGLANGSISTEGFRTPRSNGMRRVLISPSLARSDAQELIEVMLAACKSRGDCELLVKLHPECRIEGHVELLRKKFDFRHIHVVEGDIYDLIEDSDLIVTNYSTTGDEAIALGRPVICYTGLRPCAASFLDVPAAPIVHNTDEMKEAIDGMFYDDQYRGSYWLQRDSLVQGSFYRLDGLAKERVLEALLAGIGTRPAPPEQPAYETQEA